MNRPVKFICLDVGEKRIGVAVGDSNVKLAIPFDTISVNGSEVEEIKKIVSTQGADTIVVGYPRNQSGEPTMQTRFVEDFTSKLEGFASKIIFQDESMTSVLAEERLASHNRPYSKADIDSQAAAIILQDYLESKHA